MTKPPRLKQLSATLATGTLAAVSVLAGCRTRVPVEATAATQLAVAREQAFTPRVLATGNIRLLPGGRIQVGARISGVVVELPVTQGTRVNAGAIIARLDDREARARVAQAEAAVVELEATVKKEAEEQIRARALARAGGATAQEVLAASTALAIAQAQLAGARANRDLGRLQLDYTVIRAPISGVVASVTTHKGETVAASLAAPTFVTLLDPTRLECVALVDESDIGRVTIGDSVEFTVDAYPGRPFQGTVTGIAPDATIVGGVVDYEVRVRIADVTTLLKPQMTASVSIAGRPRHALTIPTAAVRQSPVGAFVWRRNGGPPERVTVTLGARQSDLSEVQSGLAPGDTILTGGFPQGK